MSSITDDRLIQIRTFLSVISLRILLSLAQYCQSKWKYFHGNSLSGAFGEELQSRAGMRSGADGNKWHR
jgi:hypothetical protein